MLTNDNFHELGEKLWHVNAALQKMFEMDPDLCEIELKICL